MDRRKIVDTVARKTSYAKWEVNVLTSAVLSVIMDTLQNGESVSIKGFGRFELKEVRTKRNICPKTKKCVESLTKKKVVFTAHHCFKVSDEVLDNMKSNTE